MSKTTFTVKDDEQTLVIERIFPAPRSKVWAAWTTPELFSKWWGPRGWNTIVKHMDFSEGGYLHYGMKCEDPQQIDWYGQISWGKSTYSNINAENSFDYVDEFCDEDGNVTPNLPIMNISLQFDESDGATKVTSTSLFDTPQALQQVIDMGMKEGLEQTWDRLEDLVS